MTRTVNIEQKKRLSYSLQEYINTTNEFCGGNVVNDRRLRFRMTPDGIEELEPLIPWEKLTYYGDMNMGATICAVSFVLKLPQFYMRCISGNNHY